MNELGTTLAWILGAPAALLGVVMAVWALCDAMTNQARDLRHLHLERRRTLRSIRRSSSASPDFLSTRHNYLAELDRRIASATPKGSTDV